MLFIVMSVGLKPITMTSTPSPNWNAIFAILDAAVIICLFVGLYAEKPILLQPFIMLSVSCSFVNYSDVSVSGT